MKNSMKWYKGHIDKYKDMIPAGSTVSLVGIECDKGWESIIDRCLSTCRRIEPCIKITQIKEKFGALRIYARGGHKSTHSKIYKLLNDYEEYSITVCEQCGAPGQKWLVKNIYYKTLCSDCYAKIVKE